jgi:hypothetical protein
LERQWRRSTLAGSALWIAIPFNQTISLQSMSTPQLIELKLGDGELFGAALYNPGLTWDLSTWTVTIHKHGLLTQTIAVAQPPKFDKHIAILRQHVPKERMESLKRIVTDEKLMAFGSFPDICMTDQEQTRLMIRLNGETIVIDAYGPHAVATMGETDADKVKANRYCRLWDAIVELTPFTPYSERRDVHSMHLSGGGQRFLKSKSTPATP